MAKRFETAALDAKLAVVKHASATIAFCSAVPAQGATVASLAVVCSKTAVNLSGITTVADSTTGRKFTVPAQTGMTVASSANIVAVVIHGGGNILAVTDPTTNPTAVVAGTWDSGAFDVADNFAAV